MWKAIKRFFVREEPPVIPWHTVHWMVDEGIKPITPEVREMLTEKYDMHVQEMAGYDYYLEDPNGEYRIYSTHYLSTQSLGELKHDLMTWRRWRSNGNRR